MLQTARDRLVFSDVRSFGRARQLHVVIKDAHVTSFAPLFYLASSLLHLLFYHEF